MGGRAGRAFERELLIERAAPFPGAAALSLMAAFIGTEKLDLGESWSEPCWPC